MKKSLEYATPFGNKVPRSASRVAALKYRVCRFFFDKGNTPIEPGAIATGEVYKDFGMLTIVDKNKWIPAGDAARREHDGNYLTVAYATGATSAGMTKAGAGMTLRGADAPLRNEFGAVAPNSRGASVNQADIQEIKTEKSVIIGTIRMGFGHWRMAIAMASAAHHLGLTPYLLDLMSFDGSTAQKSIRFLQYWYDVFSRISQKWKWFNKHVWEKATSVGSRSLASCVSQRILSQLFEPILELIPEDVPLLSMHPWVGHAAILGGVKNVVSIVPDNYPMAFWLVEGSRHTVQSPSVFMGYRTLLSMDDTYEIKHCLDPKTIFEAGHYIDYEITSEIERDCGRRIERMKQGKPRRFLLTMGGAGAQAERFADIIQTCEKFIEAGKAAFFVNMGDHAGRWKELKARLDNARISYELHTDWSATKRFVKNAELDDIRGIHIFLHDEFYAAVYLTNLLMRESDIMITKPSELSFYPVPKLFIQRVGKHEAWGAIRGSEMGDGTIETAGTRDLRRTLTTLITSDDLLEMYIRHIRLNAKSGVYNGAHNALMFATEKIAD